MAQQNLNTGSSANDGTGDSLRAAMLKIQSNFDELYGDETTGEVTSISATAPIERDQAVGVVTISLADDGVTYAKMQDTTTDNRVLGATTAGEISEVQVATDMIADDAVTEAKINVSGTGTAGQNLSSDGSGGFTWTNEVDTTYTAGDGLTLTGTDIDLDAALTTVTSIYNTGLKVGRDSGGDWIDFGTDNQIDFYVDNTNDMRLESDGDLHVEGDVIAASTTISSDEKLKENIEEYSDALDKIKQLKGVSFDWKKDGSKSGGVIAQDVQKVLPELVENVKDLNGDDSHLAVNYNGLIGLLLQSIKELSDKVDNCNNCK